MSRLNVDIKDDIYGRFVFQCEDDGRKVGDVIRELVLNYTEERANAKYELALKKVRKEEQDE